MGIIHDHRKQTCKPRGFTGLAPEEQADEPMADKEDPPAGDATVDLGRGEKGLITGPLGDHGISQDMILILLIFDNYRGP